ncbi:hypothetical protein HZ992_15240 [Rhizobacter sp. AJA081-3]|uniref:hypothetical protein n=1 Tax=Rhizobacter sp. AJA081-3 TaxID=2753607 RepID=UPI001ADFD7E4|nr:hypothetical protein [Rhizobacter sp. AJA081-3]QTN21535.1 hypothetical protein HZ992_15240 [Rhizobacter sp. AJA081-3]
MVLLFATGTASAQCDPLEAENPEREIAHLTGHAVLYPMDAARHEEITRCLFALFEDPTHSLASLTWNVTNALLRILAADPQRFLVYLPTVPLSQKRAWYSAFRYAAVVHQGRCPTPDAFALAIEALRRTQASGTRGREKAATLRSLQLQSCRVPE